MTIPREGRYSPVGIGMKRSCHRRRKGAVTRGILPSRSYLDGFRLGFMSLLLIVVTTDLTATSKTSAHGGQRAASGHVQPGQVSGDSLRDCEWVPVGYGIIKNDFETCTPQDRVLKDSVREGHWNLRIKTWSGSERILNPTKDSPTLTYRPGLIGVYDIYVGVRAIDAVSDFALQLSSEREIVQITPPFATKEKHWNLEILYRKRVRLDSVSILLYSLGNRSYIRGFRFVPLVRKKPAGTIVRSFAIMGQGERLHYGFPGVAVASNGDILVVARKGKTHASEGDFGSIVMSRSTNGGMIWTIPKVVLQEDSVDYRDPNLVCLKDGTLLLSYAPVGAGIGPAIVRSSDNGYTWSKPISTKGLFSPNGIWENEDGVYYCGIRNYHGVNVVEILRSSDAGITWSEYSTVVTSKPWDKEMSWEFYDEPALAVLPNGRWLVLFRVDLDGMMRQTVSREMGLFRTWALPQKNGIEGYPPHLLKLTDGTLVCTYGFRKEPFGIRASLSYDQGESWEIAREVVLRKDGGNSDLGYAKSVQLPNGTLLSVYYIGETDQPFTEIAGTIWKVQGPF
jgi:sialidase-1